MRLQDNKGLVISYSAVIPLEKGLNFRVFSGVLLFVIYHQASQILFQFNLIINSFPFLFVLCMRLSSFSR